MSAFIVTVLKLLGSIVSGGLLFQAFVASNHSKPITKITGVLVSLMTLFMFVIDIKTIVPGDEDHETEQVYWQSIEKHPSAKAYHHYLMEYPAGKFAAIARTQIASYANTVSVAEEQPPVLVAKLAKISADTAEAEQRYWEIIKQYPSAEAYRAYLNKYPDGHFTAIAQTQLVLYKNLSHVAQEKQPVSAPKVTQTANSSNIWQVIRQYKVKDDLVKDTRTGLMWMRCSLGQYWQGSSCQGDSIGYRWQQAMSLPEHFDFGGYSDWRMPRHEELKTLVSCSSGKTERLAVGRSLCDGNYTKPTIDSLVFPGTPNGWFWSSSPDNPDNSDGRTAWAVNFNDGYDGWDFNYSANSVRLVRSGT
jgi:hypothetical protein